MTLLRFEKVKRAQLNGGAVTFDIECASESSIAVPNNRVVDLKLSQCDLELFLCFLLDHQMGERSLVNHIDIELPVHGAKARRIDFVLEVTGK